jgi:hypothetical protein
VRKLACPPDAFCPRFACQTAKVLLVIAGLDPAIHRASPIADSSYGSPGLAASAAPRFARSRDAAAR